MAELLFNALKAIVTSSSGTMMPSGQGLECRVDMALALSLGYYFLKSVALIFQ